MGEDRGARLLGTCRGRSRAYALIEVSCDGAFQALVSSAGRELPCDLTRVCDSVTLAAHREAGGTWVLSWPFVSSHVSVSICDGIGNKLISFSLSVMESKARSRLLSAAKPQLTELMRNVELRRGAGSPNIKVTGIWQGVEGKRVWRVRGIFPGLAACETVGLRVIDSMGASVACTPILMEDHVVPCEEDPARTERIMTFSVTLDASLVHATVVAYAEGESAASSCASPGVDSDGHAVSTAGGIVSLQMPLAFDCIIPPLFASLTGEAVTRMSAAWGDPSYARWFEERRVTAAELAWQRGHAHALVSNPLISIVMPVFNPDPAFLEAALRSVEVQSYANWELVAVNVGDDQGPASAVLAAHAVRDKRVRVFEAPNRSISENTNAGIAAAKGDYVGFMDHDDALEPDCLWRYVEAMCAHPDADLLYCDEDRLCGEDVHGPAFKPGYDHEKLCAYNYVTHLLMVSRRALDLTERSGADVAGAQDYDLTLRVVEVARDIVHVPRVLYHWREHEGSTAGGENQKPYAHKAGKLALMRHIERTGGWGKVTDGRLPYTYRVRPALGAQAPKVSVIIPSKDHANLLERCVRSLLERTSYPNYEIVVVENNSEFPETFELYRRLKRGTRVHVVTWEGLGFNYSALVNFGAMHSTGEVLVLLNNDTEVIDARWLEELVGALRHPKVGVVGARLLFEDGLIQHAGMVANPNGDFAHMSQNLPGNCLGYGYSVAFPQEYSMVTGACQAVSRALFEQLGGYDERLAVGFNDGDFCLRAREAGFAVAYCPYAVLHHREFSSRGRESVDAALAARYTREKAYVIGRHAEFFSARDPAINPNLDGFSDYWQLRW